MNDTCWLGNSHVKTFMTLHNIKSVEELQLYWQKEMRNNLPSERKVINWKSRTPSLTLED